VCCQSTQRKREKRSASIGFIAKHDFENRLSMKARYNIPVRAAWQADLPSDEKTRIERAIFLAIERAVKNTAGPGSEIVAAELQGPKDTGQRFESSRYRSDTGVFRRAKLTP
jgi:hypothetical protein